MNLIFRLKQPSTPANFYKFLPYKGTILGKKKHFQLFTAKSAVYPIKSTFSDISTTTSSIPALTGISFFISFSSIFSAFGVKTKWSKNSVKSRISRYLSSSATRQPPHALGLHYECQQFRKYRVWNSPRNFALRKSVHDFIITLIPFFSTPRRR